MVQAIAQTAGVTEVDSDAVVVTAFEDSLSPAAQQVDRALDGLLTEMRDGKELSGKFAERTVVHTLGRLPAKRVVVVGLGKPKQLDTFRLHNAFWFAGAALRKQGVHSVSAYLDASVVDAISGGNGDAGAALYDTVHGVATGLLLGNFKGELNKSEKSENGGVIERVAVGGLDGREGVEEALKQAVVLAEATNQVRTWVTAPSNTLTPTLLATAAQKLYEGTGLEVEVLDKAALEREKAGALLGVARGSDEPPVMIAVRWDGGRPDGPRLALVGKGITFDTGGISIKPAGGMDMMKFDMGGGAAVLAAMWAISQLKPKANVIGVVPATENMPSGHAYKPGDVLTSMNGKTIEVLNTDAEGRIILADGMEWARRMGATHLVDVATLTGAIVVALGHANAGLFTNDEEFAAMVCTAGRRGGDRFAMMPMHPEYDVCLTSEVADMKNIGGREGGSISAAVFLREFVGDLPWVHLDIAGTVWNDQGDMTQIPKGPSGTPVRSFVHLAFEFAKL
ncbi:MAG TPA: leucyl aminopeptidase [Candidatus Dormibacteraeota bacterium]|nr:leucyl aminopeptidase [Candidatus Dormibacteraeota bacterium]